MEVTYFAKTRDIMGRDSDNFVLPADIQSINDIIEYLSAKGEPYSIAFAARDKLRFALDNELAHQDAIIANKSELAIFPPVTGG